MEDVFLPDTLHERKSPILLVLCHHRGNEGRTVQRDLQFHQLLGAGARWMDELFLPGPHHRTEG